EATEIAEVDAPDFDFGFVDVIDVFQIKAVPAKVQADAAAPREIAFFLAAANKGAADDRLDVGAAEQGIGANAAGQQVDPRQHAAEEVKPELVALAQDTLVVLVPGGAKPAFDAEMRMHPSNAEATPSSMSSRSA